MIPGQYPMKHPSSAPCPEMAAGVRESVPAAAPYHAGRPAVALTGRIPAIRLHARAGDTEPLRFRPGDPVTTMPISEAVENSGSLSRSWPGRNPSGAHGLLHRQCPGRFALVGSRGSFRQRKSWCCAVTGRAMPVTVAMIRPPNAIAPAQGTRVGNPSIRTVSAPAAHADRRD